MGRRSHATCAADAACAQAAVRNPPWPREGSREGRLPGMESSIYRASKELYAIEGNGAREAFIAAWTKPKKGIERYGAD